MTTEQTRDSDRFDSGKDSVSPPAGTGPTWGTRGVRGWQETSYPLVPSQPQEIIPGIVRILAPNPGIFTGPGTNTYVIRSGKEAAVVDPGPADPRHLEAVEAAVKSLRCSAILLSHHHPDHAEGAAVFKEHLGAPIAGYPSKLDVDIALEDGTTISVGKSRIVSLHTPGHASDHLCFSIDEPDVVLTGDHLLGGNTSVIAPPDGNMKDYIESLEKLSRQRPEFALPGHGQPLPEPLAAIEWYIEHRLQREKAIVGLLESGDERRFTIAEIVEEIYSDIPESAHTIARYSVWAHLLKLEDEGRVQAVGGEGIESSWQLVSKVVSG